MPFDIWAARRSLALIGEGDWTPQDSLLGLACDEIERLRGALVSISGYGISPNNGYPIVSADVVKVAKKALS